MTTSRCNDTLHCMIPTPEEEARERWIDTAPFGRTPQTVAESLETLKSQDRATWAMMMERIRRVQRGEIRQFDLDRGAVIAPAGLRVDQKKLQGPRPWMAEIKADRTKDPRMWHRVYFGDVADAPGEPKNRMVAAGTHTKTDKGKRSASAQTKSMESALKALIWWCANRGGGISYRRG